MYEKVSHTYCTLYTLLNLYVSVDVIFCGNMEVSVYMKVSGCEIITGRRNTMHCYKVSDSLG